MSDKAVSFDRLLERLQTVQVFIPEEVAACLYDNITQANVQRVSSIRATSATTKKKLGRQLAALANSAQLIGSKLGYFVFELTDSLISETKIK